MPYRYFMVTVLLLTLAAASIPTRVTAETHLHITTGFTPPVSNFFQAILAEVDTRLPDISISFEVLPAERSLVLSNQGINDGECCRIINVIEKEYPDLIPVNVSFFSARFNVFGKIKRKIESFDDLKPYSVGSVEGWKIAVIKVREINAAETHIVTTPEQLFLMLNENRLDYGVVGYLSGLESISQLGLKNKIYALEPPLIEKELFLLLHRKHQKLIPVLNDAIDALIRDGTIDRLYGTLLESL